MKPQRNPVKTVGIERRYAAQLRTVAKQVGAIINGFPPLDPKFVPTIQKMLDAYAQLLVPWATATATKMLHAVNQADERAWRAVSGEISKGLVHAINTTPVGDTMLGLLAEQVHYIKSLPIEAGQRVHTLTVKALENSTRSSEIAKEIMRSGEVCESRAKLIARTEVARTASKLTEARAMGVGSTGYVWETSRDGDVRDSHREMQGKVIEWSNPPTLSDGTTTHAGQIYNCRCWPRVILPPVDGVKPKKK